MSYVFEFINNIFSCWSLHFHFQFVAYMYYKWTGICIVNYRSCLFKVCAVVYCRLLFPKLMALSGNFVYISKVKLAIANVNSIYWQ